MDRFHLETVFNSTVCSQLYKNMGIYFVYFNVETGFFNSFINFVNKFTL